MRLTLEIPDDLTLLYVASASPWGYHRAFTEVHMKGLLSALTILLVACGGNGGGQDDTSTDSTQDTLDTQDDTATDSTLDTVEDTSTDALQDTMDTQGDTATDTTPDTVEDTPIDGECSGTWFDPTTGYLWENPPSIFYRNWDDAISYCNGLSLCGRSAGEWHLPTISELRTIIRGCPATEDGGACGVTDSCLDSPCFHDCSGCSGGGGPGVGGCHWDPVLEGPCYWYKSSSSLAAYPSDALIVAFYDGSLASVFKDDDEAVRCVSP